MSSSKDSQFLFGIFSYLHGSNNLEVAKQINREICERHGVLPEEGKDFLMVINCFYILFTTAFIFLNVQLISC